MRKPLQQIQQALSKNRVFLMGAGVGRIEETGAAFKKDQSIQIQENIALEPYTTFWGQSGRNLVTMGSFSYTNSVLPMSVSLGRYCSIGSNFKVLGARHPKERASTSPVFYNQKLKMNTFAKDHGVNLSPQRYEYDQDPITIGNDVWVGDDVTFGHGVTIGDGAVVAAGSLVLDDVEPFTVVGGHPAKPIHDRFGWEATDALTDSQWWRFSPEAIGHLDTTNPEEFGMQVQELRSAGKIAVYKPEPMRASDFA